ncbi:MAG: haloacid dehalogenase [Actinobacteria bacterium]|nr:haloacid dehalogenase [Actinomycetota bacterium]
MEGSARSAELDAIEGDVRRELEGAHRAREVSLAACRRTIRACGNAIRATHRRDTALASALADEAAAALAEAHAALRPFPALAAAGPLHDAEKEYAEARLTAALVTDAGLPTAHVLGVAPAAWLNGLAEAASELRRHALDRLRDGDLARGEALLGAMGDVYDMLLTVDFPDAVTGGLRRSTDALRTVLERTRGDVTTTLLQARLQEAIEAGLGPR